MSMSEGRSMSSDMVNCSELGCGGSSPINWLRSTASTSSLKSLILYEDEDFDCAFDFSEPEPCNAITGTEYLCRLGSTLDGG